MQSFFGGSLSSKNKRECGHVTGTRQKFYVLDVEIPGSSPGAVAASGTGSKGVSLQDCLAHLVAGEHMRGDQQMQCDQCTAAKVTYGRGLPPPLITLLLRCLFAPADCVTHLHNNCSYAVRICTVVERCM